MKLFPSYVKNYGLRHFLISAGVILGSLMVVIVVQPFVSDTWDVILQICQWITIGATIAWQIWADNRDRKKALRKTALVESLPPYMDLPGVAFVPESWPMSDEEIMKMGNVTKVVRYARDDYEAPPQT